MTIFNKNIPKNSSRVNEMGNPVRSNRSALDEIIQTHFNWSNDTANTGAPNSSASTANSLARFYYGPRSELSYPGRDGSGMIISDESRAVVFSSSNSYVIGGQRAMHHVSSATIIGTTPGFGGLEGYKQLTIHGQETTANATANEEFAVTFGTTFGGLPHVIVSNIDDEEWQFSVNAVTRTGFTLGRYYHGAGAATNFGTCAWRSSGTTGP